MQSHSLVSTLLVSTVLEEHQHESEVTYQQLPISLDQEDSGCSQQHAHTDGPNCIKDAVACHPCDICGNGCKDHGKQSVLVYTSDLLY